MSTPHGPERRTQALRRSGAAGVHDQRPTRSEAERAAVADQDVPWSMLKPMDIYTGPEDPLGIVELVPIDEADDW